MNTPWSVLILDDDPGVRQSIRLCLEADGEGKQYHQLLVNVMHRLSRAKGMAD